MTLIKKYFLFICIVFLYTNTLAFQKDTTSTNDTVTIFYFKTQGVDSSETPQLHKVDTLLKGVQKYDPLNKPYLFAATFANIGLPYKSMFFSPDISIDFDIGFHNLDGYLYKNEEIKYYQVHSSFTNLNYANGPEKEQIFRLIHSQKIKKRFNIGVDFQIINSQGIYYRQKSDNKNFVLTSHYLSKNNRYGFIANYIHNKLKIQENGGIVDELVFEKDTMDNRRLIYVNLQGAENRLKKSEFNIKQFYNLNFKTQYADTTGKNKYVNLGKFTHVFHYSKQSFVYEDSDPMSGFYSFVYFDSLKTLDSMHVNKIENVLGWTTAGGEKKNLINVFLYIKHQHIEISEDISRKDYFSQLIPSAGISTNEAKRFSFRVYGEQVKGGYNDGDYKLNGEFAVKLTDRSKFVLKRIYVQQSPVWFYTHYKSNHFRWDYELKKCGIVLTGGAFQYKKLQIGINHYLLSDFLYYDAYALPKQAIGSFELINVYLFKDFQIGRLSIDNKLIYQKVLQYEVLRLPEVIANHSIYYNCQMFKNALGLQAGFDIFYNTSYYADAYMPATRQFYLQNDKKIGDYAYIDFFVNFKIKRARLFLKLQHLNEGLMDYKYYMVPRYPMQDRALKFGVSWRFYG